MTATRRHLVRHGHVENPQRRIYGRLPGWPLSAHIYSSPLGERMARVLRAIAGLHDRRVRTGGLVAVEMGSATVRIVEDWEPHRSGKR